MMKSKWSDCAAGILGLCWAGTAAAQTATDRAVELFTCKDVMREPNTSREVAIAFLHGYLLASPAAPNSTWRRWKSKPEQCLDNPKDSAADVMAKLKK